MLRLQADLEEAYILSAFRRKEGKDVPDGGVDREAETQFLDLCSPPAHPGAKEAPEAADTGPGLPSVEALRATLQALRVQDRLARMEAPTVPSLAMAAGTAPAGQLEEQSEVGRAIAAELANVTTAEFSAEAQELLA